MALASKPSVRALAGGALAALAGVASMALVRAFSELDVRVGGRTKAGRVIAFTDRTAKGGPMRLMVVGRAVQSASYLGERRFELPFEYYRAFDTLFSALPGARDVLMLGGGGFAWPKHALTTREQLCVDVCEPEDAVINAARAWFFLDELEARAGARLRIFATDGISYLRVSERAYDAVINDAFEGAFPAKDLVSDEGLALVRAHLAPGGLYLINVVCGQDLSSLRELTGRLGQAFAHVHVLLATDEALSDDDNYLVIATDGDYRFEGEL